MKSKEEKVDRIAKKVLKVLIYIWSLSLIISGSLLIGASKEMKTAPIILIIGIILNIIVFNLDKIWGKNEKKKTKRKI